MFSKTLLVVLVVYFSSNFSHGQRDKEFFRKDYNYIEEVSSFYKIYPTNKNWSQAKRVCALEGASLFYPDSREEANAVIAFWNSTYPNVNWQVLVGLTDLIIEGVFETIDGKLISEVYNQWAPGEPNNNLGQSEEDCVILNQQGKTNDVSCDDLFHFICKKTLLSLEWNYHCNMSNLDYTLNEDIGKCYKLHSTPLTWTEAYAVCRAEQSYLAVINNQLEADYLANLTESTPKLRGKYQKGIYHMGFHNRLNEGWQTVRGTPINDNADAWWNNYMPTEDEQNMQCGSMFYNGRLNNINCDTKSFFICEHIK